MIRTYSIIHIGFIHVNVLGGEHTQIYTNIIDKAFCADKGENYQSFISWGELNIYTLMKNYKRTANALIASKGLL